MLHNMNNTAILMHSKRERASKDHLGILRTPGYLARWPLIGLLMILLGGVAFSAFAINLETNGPLIKADMQVGNYIHQAALRSPIIIRDVMISGFYIGEQVIAVIGALLAVYYLYRRFLPELFMVVIAWLGEIAIFYFSSHFFNRPRPVYPVPVWHQMIHPGFPSGHSISAVMCYGLLAYLLAPKMASRFWKAVVIVAAVVIILFIGFSRIFVGDHYLTDVLAGYAIGFIWSGLVYTSIELIMWKRKEKLYEQER